MSEIRINKLQNNLQNKTTKETKQEAHKEEAATPKTELKQKSADEVLNFMANSSALTQQNIKKKPVNASSVDVSKYIDKKSEERIRAAMQDFEKTIFGSAEIAIKEFGLSEDAATDAAILAFNRQYLS